MRNQDNRAEAAMGKDAVRVRQIFGFVAAAEQSRTRPVRTLEGAKAVVWFANLPEDPSVRSVLKDDAASTSASSTSASSPSLSSGDEPAWLAIRRPQREVPPKLPRLLEPWVDPALVRDYSNEEAPPLLRRDEPGPENSEAPPFSQLPQLGWQAESASGAEEEPGGPSEDDAYEEPDDSPRPDRIEKLYDTWEARWREWAAKRRAAEPVIELYDWLHKMYEDAHDLGEAYELVLAFGRLTWHSTSGDRIERHLITHRAVLHLDSATGTITASPDRSAPGFLLEEAMLDAEQQAQGPVREEIREALDEAADATDPEQLDHLHTALRSWTNAAHSAGRYLVSRERQVPESLAEPTVGFTPALVLRERTSRSTLQALQSIAHQVEMGERPTELLRYIAGADGALTAAEQTPPEGGAEQELYFAEAANDEQRTIAERLRHNRLVVVQGPPGTGKTHTIANLTTDLLARGQRVLITSQTNRALRVLRDKLPRDVRDLCVSRTEDGNAAQRELEHSMQRILSRHGEYDPGASRSQVTRLETRLATARKAQQELLQELAAVRELETRVFTEVDGFGGGYAGSLQQIARELVADAPRHEWIGPVPVSEPSLTSAEALRLLHTARDYTPQQQALAAEVPETGELPSPGSFERAVAAVREADEAGTGAEAGEVSLPLERLDASAQEALSEAVESYDAARTAAETAAEAGGWTVGALNSVLAGQDWEARSRRQELAGALDEVDAAVAELGGAMVTGLETYQPSDAFALATTLHDGLVRGERLRGTFGTRTKLAKSVGEFIQRVRVDGRAPEDAGNAEKLLAHVRTEMKLAQLEADSRSGVGAGGPVAGLGAGGARHSGNSAWRRHGQRLAALRQDREVLDELLTAGQARRRLVEVAASVPELASADWQKKETTTAVRALLRAREPRALIAGAAGLLREWTDQSGAAPALVRAREAVAAHDPDAYREACEELASVRAAVRLRAAHSAALTAVREALPGLAEQIIRDPYDEEWEQRLGGLAEAWAWSAWRERIERLTDPDAERDLRARLTQADDEVRLTLGKLAAARAWDSSLGQLTGDQTRALKAFRQAVRHTKGKYRHRYRRDAQTALRSAQTAVPAWIMPLHLVAETVPMDQPGLFDVVIVDEASQSRLDAMLLTWLGRRVVVVGDNEQVSPSNVGIGREEHFRLQDKMLSQLPADHRGLFGPERSFFDLTEALAGGRGSLMLKEHFRCMPEIIAYSNQECYGGELLPLRQYGADRLPPVRTVLVEGGETTGTGQRRVNHREARALVDAVERCCNDPAYAGKTMGVVSLRSSTSHLQTLDSLLVERLGWEERDGRQLRVGNAEDFQGDERDVMFLSFVNSPDTAAGTVSGGYSIRMYQQRLNVAASRARDQVWAFHSARTEQFHEGDLRRTYLDVLERPVEESVAAVAGTVSPGRRHEAFENLFQQQVYLEITGLGYRVRPQYRVGRHPIDLVVEGGTRKLAVECDGDEFGEGEDAASAAARQRDLERVDWTFVRIRGSRFALDREAALAPLWEELERLGIEPDPGPYGDVAEPEQHEEPGESDEQPETGEPRDAGDAGETAFGDGRLTYRWDSFPVQEIAPSCFARVLREQHALQKALSAHPGGAGDGDDGWRRRYENRVEYLRAFVDAVSADGEAEAPPMVVPGALVHLDFDGAGEAEAEEGDVPYTVAELDSEGARAVSPSSPLGRALMWQPPGREVEFVDGSGRARKAVVRGLQP